MVTFIVVLFSPLLLLGLEILENDSEYTHRVRHIALFAIVIKGFPARLIDTLRCNKDGERLRLDGPDRDANSIIEGKVSCAKCGAAYKIQDGILEMFEDDAQLDERSKFEMATRDVEADKREDPNDLMGALSEIDGMEVPTTLGQLGNPDGKAVLEIGCGTGRYTRALAESCGSLLAVDFSRKSLLVNAESMPANRTVGFVRADAGHLKLKEESFDLALSTVYSNLPSPEIRSRSTESVSQALKVNGRYVVSTHHHDIREIIRGISAAGEYDNGIFFQKFTKSSLRAELERYFSKIEMKTACIWVPYISRLKTARVPASKLSESVPILNRLGALLLATAVKDRSSLRPHFHPRGRTWLK